MSGVLGDVFKPKIMVLIGLSSGRDSLFLGALYR